MGYSEHDPGAKARRPWNAGRLVGAKRALKAQQVWAVRFWWKAACPLRSGVVKMRTFVLRGNLSDYRLAG